VGYRWFVERAARELGLSGYARNLADGRVEVYVTGAAERIDQIAARLATGPELADVRSVNGMEAAVEKKRGFRCY
jgi:acylphosphatase